MRTINVSLSDDSLSAAIRIVEGYKKEMLQKAGEVVDAVAKDVDTEARRELTKHVWSGETINSLTTERKSDTAYTRSANVKVGGAAVWLEFGTGVVANGCAVGEFVHPMPGVYFKMNGIGTYRKGHGADPDGWYWEDEFGEYHHTFGIPATMFMWNAAQLAKRNIPSTARRVFLK